MLRARPVLATTLLSLLPILFAGLLASCGTDEDEAASGSPSQPFTEEGPPWLPVPIPRVHPGIAAVDSLARYAKGTVIGQFNRIRLISQAAESAHAAMNGKGWGIASESCRFKQIGDVADTLCSFTLYVCNEAGGYEWIEIVSGPCAPGGPSGPSLAGWTALSGMTSRDGNSGSFQTYRMGTTVVAEAWSWDSSADHKVVDWHFYKGSRDNPRNLVGALRWDRRGTEFEVGEFQWSDQWKWGTEITPDGRRGRMTVFRQDSSASGWIKQIEIDWTPAHGNWLMYDSSGAVVEELAW